VPDERLCPGSLLRSDEFLVSPDRKYDLYMQADGNLVLQRHFLRAENEEPAWASDTADHPGAHAEMRPDGSFVVLAPGGAVLWSSRTAGHPGSYLVVTDRPSAAVYTPAGKQIWAIP
jgi:hypothetical protein